MNADSPAAERFLNLKRVLSFPVMLSGLLVVLAVLTVGHRFDDPDLWWHLKMGEVILRTHVIPTTDIFSWTTSHHAWTPHEWLSQIFIYSAYAQGGYSGLMLWLCSMAAALFIAGYALCSLYSGNAKVSFLGALAIWLFSTVGLAIRPQMVGYLLLIVESILIHLGRTRNPRWFYWLPPLFAVWINCHGSFFVGLIVAGIFLFSACFEFRAGLLVSVRWGLHERRSLTLALLLSIAALFVNPIGWNQIMYPLTAMFKLPISMAEVQEWRPILLSGPHGIAFMGVVGGMLLILILKQSELYWHELLLLSLGIWLATSHERMLFVFGILAAPLLSRLLANSWEGYDPRRDRPLPNAVMLALAAATAWWVFPGSLELTRQVELSSPVKAVEFVNAHHLPGNMLNDYGYGGYLIWAAQQHPVFVDGRGDVFEWTGVLADFRNWATLRSDPNTLLDKYGVDFCLLAKESPMARVLPLLHNWRIAYSDKNSVVFVRDPARAQLK